MTRTQIQLPDALYRQAKDFAAANEISLAELVRNGIAYMLRVCAKPDKAAKEWKFPAPLKIDVSEDYLNDPNWRANLYFGSAGFSTRGSL
jgi:hypothetical protein